MASEYKTGYYLDHGNYGGQQYLGGSVSEALKAVKSHGDIDRLIHDHVYVDWEIDREWNATGIVYEGLLELTRDRIAETALESLQESTNAAEGPVFGGVYWWEKEFSDSPRPPPEAWKPPVVNVKYTVDSNRKAKPNVSSENRKAPVKKPAKKATARKPARATPRRR